MFGLFKKKKQYSLFGRVRASYEPSRCDLCDKIVSWSDYVYLCKDCHSKLPDAVLKCHHVLVPYKEARVLFLNEAIKMSEEGNI